MNAALTETDLAHACDEMLRLEQALGSAVVGQPALVRDALTAVVAGGHLLIEGLPGLGKTQLALGIAALLGVPLARIQCTPDLMPADITGAEILVHDPDGGTRLDFRPGPLFAPLVLVDEINRAMPKTQAALLEAMQERHVTWAGQRYQLPPPFTVLATQNPIELEGTYPLPEAQLDRFMFKVRVDYPDAEALLGMLDVALDDDPAERLEPLLDAGQLATLGDLARQVVIAEPLRRAAVALVLATQPDADPAAPIAYGASPRGLQALLRAARVRALTAGRPHVAMGDLEAVALPALRHRVLLTLEGEVAGTDVDDLLRGVLGRWRDRHGHEAR